MVESPGDSNAADGPDGGAADAAGGANVNGPEGADL